MAQGDEGDRLKIEWRLGEWFKDLSEEDLIRFRYYHMELIRFNKTINLVSSKSVFDADVTHFADCIIAGRMILQDCAGRAITDLGSGNGFPGLVIALMDPGRKVVLIESDGRKVEFLRFIKDKLQLKMVDVVNERIENLKDDSVDCGVSRGLAPISKSLLMTRRAFRLGGRYYHMKGDHWSVELASIPSQLCSSWEPKLLGEYKLPIGALRMAVVVTQRVK